MTAGGIRTAAISLMKSFCCPRNASLVRPLSTMLTSTPEAGTFGLAPFASGKGAGVGASISEEGEGAKPGADAALTFIDPNATITSEHNKLIVMRVHGSMGLSGYIVFRGCVEWGGLL
jgi:hypothetical protein